MIMVAFRLQEKIMIRKSIYRVCFPATAFLLFSISALCQDAVPLPHVSSKRLLNDLQITVAQTPYLGDDMTIGLVLRYGAAFDPLPDKGGVSYLLSRMFMKATSDKTQKDILDELAYLDAALEIQCDWDGFRFLLRGKSPRYERSLLLLYQIVVEAQFNNEDFAAVKQSILNDLQTPPDPRRRIHVQLETVLFSGTTYGRPLQGTPLSASGITLGDIGYFYRRYFSPNQAAVEIVGNVPTSEVLQKASRIWGVWVRKDNIPFTFVPPSKPADRRILLEDDPNSPAAQFIIGGLFPPRQNPVYKSARLAAHILQERLTRLLPTSLVTANGGERRMGSPFYIQAQAAADQAVEEIRKILKAVEEMQNKPVSDEELAAAKTAFIDEFNRQLRTTSGLCNIMMDSELYRLGSNYAAVYPDQIRRLDAVAIRRAADNWILPGGEIILIRGPAAVLKAELGSLGTIQELIP
jgi:zinc protease